MKIENNASFQKKYLKGKKKARECLYLIERKGAVHGKELHDIIHLDLSFKTRALLATLSTEL
jgi:hypothetical protein